MAAETVVAYRLILRYEHIAQDGITSWLPVPHQLVDPKYFIKKIKSKKKALYKGHFSLFAKHAVLNRIPDSDCILNDIFIGVSHQV